MQPELDIGAEKIGKGKAGGFGFVELSAFNCKLTLAMWGSDWTRLERQGVPAHS